VHWQDAGQTFFAPTTIEGVVPGLHQFAVSLPGHQTLDGTVEIGERQQITIIAQLGLEIDGGGVRGIGGRNYDTSDDDTEDEDVGERTNLIRILPTNFFEGDQEVLRVREEPSAGGLQMGVVDVGDTLPYLGVTQNGWHQVIFQGRSGWVSSEFAVVE
jgi:hypothetical protein